MQPEKDSTPSEQQPWTADTGTQSRRDKLGTTGRRHLPSEVVIAEKLNSVLRRNR